MKQSKIEKPSLEIKKRTSGKKTGNGANFGNIRELPHPAAILFGLTPEISEDNQKTSENNQDQIDSKKRTTLTTLTSQSKNKPVISNDQEAIETPISPINNFQKVPNSITKIAIPSGMFKQGKSKQLYDVLYSLTRGHFEPKRSIRISKKELMKLAGIGSRITFDSGINHLLSVGLINLTVYTGEHAGNDFEVFLYEETLTRQPSQSSQTSHAQKLDSLVSLESSQTRQSSIIENKGAYGFSNTSFKTNTKTDDEKKTLAQFENVFETISQKLVGKGLQVNESEKWKKLAELLVLELEAASLRTETISSIPAFLTEHLRRRLWSNAKKENAIQKGYKKDTLEKSEIDSGAIEAVTDDFINQDEDIPELLTEKQREMVLSSMKEFIEKGNEEFVMSLENTYRKEDWDWLMKELKNT